MLYGLRPCWRRRVSSRWKMVFPLSVFLRRDPDDLGAGQAIQQDIAGGRRWGGRVGRAQDEPTVQTQSGRGNGRGAGMVGLGAAAGQDGVGPMRDRIGHDEFQLSDFVPGEFHPGQVIPFDIDFHPHLPARMGQELKRCGRSGQVKPWWRDVIYCIRIHLFLPYFVLT